MTLTSVFNLKKNLKPMLSCPFFLILAAERAEYEL